ncbi:MAG: hypothetical protein MUF10_04580 [Thermoanaerobaculaceae bacterium]|jgi:hypothetical protein|nr:hypothetical protein [Thermoanaerobaculaceae bacterium]
MADTYAVVVARVERNPETAERKVVCYPDGAQLLYRAGPTLIRWVFQNVPAEIDDARVEFFGSQPMDKYQRPATKPVLGKQALGDHRTKLEVSTSGSHLRDLVTIANNQEEGYFFYKVVLMRGGVDVISSDPGGGNSPETPLPWPP